MIHTFLLFLLFAYDDDVNNIFFGILELHLQSFRPTVKLILLRTFSSHNSEFRKYLKKLPRLKMSFHFQTQCLSRSLEWSTIVQHRVNNWLTTKCWKHTRKNSCIISSHSLLSRVSRVKNFFWLIFIVQ